MNLSNNDIFGGLNFIDKELNDIGNITHGKLEESNYEFWADYDDNGNLVHLKDNTGYETWSEYDEFNREIKYKNQRGVECTMQYMENGDIMEHFYDGKRYTTDIRILSKLFI